MFSAVLYEINFRTRKELVSLKWSDVKTRQTAQAARVEAGEEVVAGRQQTEPLAQG